MFTRASHCTYTPKFRHTASCLPLIPEKGTVGASGDLAPLAHLALGLMGEGLMWSPSSGWANAADVSLYTSIIIISSSLASV